MSVNISAPLTQLGVLFLPHKIQAVGGNAWDKRGEKKMVSKLWVLDLGDIAHNQNKQIRGKRFLLRHRSLSS